VTVCRKKSILAADISIYQYRKDRSIFSIYRSTTDYLYFMTHAPCVCVMSKLQSLLNADAQTAMATSEMSRDVTNESRGWTGARRLRRRRTTTDIPDYTAGHYQPLTRSLSEPQPQPEPHSQCGSDVDCRRHSAITACVIATSSVILPPSSSSSSSVMTSSGNDEEKRRKVMQLQSLVSEPDPRTVC